MATVPVTPAAAPAAAPAASSPAPVPVSTPAPAPEATPTPTVENAPSLSEAWSRATESVTAAEGEAAAAEVVAEPPAAEVPAEVPATEGETGKEPEAAAPAEEVPEMVLQEDGWDPKALNDFLKTDAAVEKFFNEHPAEKNRFFAMARRDNETRAIRQIAPTVEIAKEMERGHTMYSTLDNAFLEAEHDTKPFMDTFVQQALIVDDKGVPVKDADGKYKMHPAFTNILNTIQTNRNQYLLSQIAKDGKVPPQLADVTLGVIDFLAKSDDERIQTAAQILKEAITPSSSASGSVPDELKPYAESLKAKEKELADKQAALDRNQSESAKAANIESLRKAETKAAEVCISQVNPKLKAAGLSPFEIKAARERIGNLVDEQLRGNEMYQRTYDRLAKGTPGAEREKALSRHILTYTQEILGDIVTGVLREATEGKLARQDATATRVAEQQRDSRTDPRGTSATAPSSGPQTMEQVEAALVKEFKDSHNGEAPDRRWITENIWKRMAAPPARRTA